MSALTIVFSVILLIFALAVIIVVMLQEGNQTGLSGAVGGSSDSFFSKNQTRSVDAFLNKWTKFIALGFFIVTLICDLIAFANL